MKNEDVTKWANRYGLDKFPSELRAMINDAHKLVQQEDDLYTTPPAAQRPWVGLTDEEKHEIELKAGITEDDDGYIASQVFRLTEAKLKELNA
jgi:hypothetical protein